MMIRAPFIARVWSLGLIGGSVLALSQRPEALGTDGSVLARLLGAVLLIGLIGAALHAVGWRSTRLHLEILARPGVCWAAITIGLLGGFVLRPWLGMR